MNKFRGRDIFHEPSVYTCSVTWPAWFCQRFTSSFFLPDGLRDLTPDQRAAISDKGTEGFGVIAKVYCLTRCFSVGSSRMRQLVALICV